MSTFSSSLSNFFSAVSSLNNIITNQINGLTISANCSIIADSMRFFYNMYCVNFLYRSIKIGTFRLMKLSAVGRYWCSCWPPSSWAASSACATPASRREGNSWGSRARGKTSSRTPSKRASPPLTRNSPTDDLYSFIIARTWDKTSRSHSKNNKTAPPRGRKRRRDAMTASATTSAGPTDKGLCFTHQISLPLKGISEQEGALKAASPSRTATTTTASSTKTHNPTARECGSRRPTALSEAFSLTANSQKVRWTTPTGPSSRERC